VCVYKYVYRKEIRFLRTANKRKPLHGLFGAHSLMRRIPPPLNTVVSLCYYEYIRWAHTHTHDYIRVWYSIYWYLQGSEHIWWLYLYNMYYIIIRNDDNNNNNDDYDENNKNKNQDGWPMRGDEWKDRVLQLMVYPRSPEPNQQSLFGGSEGQSFHYGSLSTVAAADRQSSQLGRPLRNVFLPASSQSAENLYKTR